MIRVNHLNPLFQSTKSKFSKEEKAMKYNTTLIEIQEYQEELKEKTQVVKRRVKLKK